METSSNKELIRTFYKKVFVEHDSPWIIENMCENYIQHNPHLPTGRAGFLQALDYLRRLPRDSNERPSFLLIEEGSYVASLWYAVLAGTRKIIIDLFRIDQGKLAEHWDATADSLEAPMHAEYHDPITDVKKAVLKFAYDQEPTANVIRMISEQNLALVQSRMEQSGQQFVIYTVVSVAHDRINDFRQIKQRIPDTMPHENGMI